MYNYTQDIDLNGSKPKNNLSKSNQDYCSVFFSNKIKSKN